LPLVAMAVHMRTRLGLHVVAAIGRFHGVPDRLSTGPCVCSTSIKGPVRQSILWVFCIKAQGSLSS